MMREEPVCTIGSTRRAEEHIPVCRAAFLRGIGLPARRGGRPPPGAAFDAEPDGPHAHAGDSSGKSTAARGFSAGSPKSGRAVCIVADSNGGRT